MKNFSLSWLFQFQQLYELGSYTRTALKLNISQQALSKNMYALEAWAGQALLRRQYGKLEPTLAGAELYRAVPELLQSLQRVEGSIHTKVSQLRIGVSLFWAQHHLSQALSRLLQAWPELDLRVVPLYEKDIQAFLQAGELSMGLVTGPPGPFLHRERLPGIPWVLAAAPALAQAEGPLPYLTYFNPFESQIYQHEALIPQPARCIGRISTWTLLSDLILAGTGAGLILEPYIRAGLQAGELVALTEKPLLYAEPSAVWIEGLEPHPALRDLLGWLSEDVSACAPSV